MAFDSFLKIDGIPGESTDDNHADWIELSAFEHEIEQSSAGSTSTGGARTAGRCDHGDFVVTKNIDKATPKLFLNCCNGTHIPQIVLHLCRETGAKQKYMEYVFKDVIISKVETIRKSEESLPAEKISFNYANIELIYTETDHNTGKAKGDIKSYWDLSKNVGG
ncbi:Hcp family type VI secretion system effector [Sedimentisphaera salicampi]|uniref:Type VI secretion system effector, Hcp1 family n=1 Tax=Sedimentisphaera salicampi TaxID=1941349 RepID=A0A1W6LMF7_9BACT|nr:type VI secretion system tube protein Hcp [Sedimentisphaera salicampi]ARN56932.1 type VI secretion system effector, Hcp1 family [Sedimentisphaera salicampi]